jgi:Xaa-Pro aminopeptidase
MDTPTRPDWPGRLRRLAAELDRLHVDAFVVSTPQNIRYLCGFTGSAGLLLVGAEQVQLITDGRYAFAVRQALDDGALGPVDLARVDKRYDLTLAQAVATAGIARLGFEASQVTVATLGAWQRAAPQAVWIGTERVVEDFRLVKDGFEIDVLRRGGGLISGVIRRLPTLVEAGLTERAVAARIELALESAGFSGPSFPTIVASGQNSALPHAHPTDRRLSAGDLVVLDFGGVLDGYCLDVTRMAAVGVPSERGLALFEAVKAAQETAVRAVRPGIPTSDVDAAARGVLEARGFGEAFMHSTGHGLGLDVHEAPRIGRADPDAPELVRTGMVFTIEPGAYLEGFGGVRLEDDVLVTTTGVEELTTAPRDLVIV